MPGTKSDGSITIDTKLDNSGFAKGSAELGRAVKSLIDRVNKTGGKIRDAFKIDFGRKNDLPLNQKQAEQYNKIVKQVDELTKALEHAEAAQEKLVNDFGKSKEYTDLENRIKALKVYQKAYDDAMARGDSSTAAKLFMDSGADKKSIPESIKSAEAELTKMWDKFENSAALRSSDKEIEKLKQKLAAAKEEAAQFKNEIQVIPNHPIQSFKQALSKVTLNARWAVSSLSKLAGSAISKGLHRIADSAKQAAKRLADMAKNTIRNGLHKLGSVITNLGKRTNKTNKSLTGGFKALLTYAIGVYSLTAIVNKLRNATLEGFKNLAKQDKQFGKIVDDFNTSLDLLKNSFAAAFAPIAEIVLPLLTSLIDRLASAVSKVGQLIAALTGKSTYKQAIKSQSNMAENTADATKAMDDEAEAAKEAQKTLAGFDDVEILSDNSDKNKKDKENNFKEAPIEDRFNNLADALKNMWKMADFTELGRMLGTGLKNALDKIPWDKIKSVSSRLGKSLATLMNGFMEVPGLFYAIGNAIAQGINTIFEFLDAFVTNFHWASLGTAIKDLILGVLYNIDWPLIYHTMGTLGAGIGTALENALNNPEIWTAIFTSISLWFGAILTGINEFFMAVDWASLGGNIGIGLNEGIEAFDWNLLSETLINAINAIFDFAYNFLTTFDFYKFGAHIGTTLSDTVKGINWTEGGASVAEAINGLFNALRGFVQNTDWKALGKAVIDAIGGFFGSIQWDNWGETLSSVIKGLFDFLSGAIEEVDWAALPGKIVDAISSFLRGFDWSGVAKATGELIGASFEASFAMGSAIWNAMKGIGKNIIDGGFEGIKETLADIGGWIKTNIVDPFIEGFKSAFGIASPATTMVPLGKYVIQGMLSGITDVFSSIKDWIKTNISDPFINGIKNLFGLDGGENVLISVGKDLIGGLKFGLSGAMDGAGDWIDSNIATPICGFFKDLFGINSPSTVFASYGQYMMEGLKGGFDDNQDLPKSALVATQLAMQTIFTASKKINEWKNIGSNLLNDGLKNGILAKTSAITTIVSKLETDMRSAVKKNTSNWKTTGNALMEHLKTGLSAKQTELISASNNIMSTVSAKISSFQSTFSSSGRNLMNSLQNGINSFGSQNWYNVGSNIGTGIYNGLVAAGTRLYNLAWNTAVNMYNAACNALGISSPSKEFIWIGEMITKGLGEGVNATQGDAVDAVTSLADAVIKEAEETGPVMQIDTAVNGVDSVLSDFSDRVVQSFSAMVSAMERIVNGSSFAIPAVATGTITPYASRRSASQDNGSLSSLLESMMLRDTDRLTRDDLMEVLVSVCKQYMNFEFYLGDEQIARHANAGNTKLNRRYSTVKD